MNLARQIQSEQGSRREEGGNRMAQRFIPSMDQYNDAPIADT